MKTLVCDFRVVTIRLRPLLILWLVLPMMLASSIHAQSNSDSVASRRLSDEIASIDTSFFQAYNECDLTKMEMFFSGDVEFYHEKRGVITTKTSVMEAIAKNLCGDPNNKVRRELVKGSLQVYPIDNYGAVAIGEHRFYLTQTGKQERLDGVGKFVNLWKKEDGQWRMSRVLSYGFGSGK